MCVRVYVCVRVFVTKAAAAKMRNNGYQRLLQACTGTCGAVCVYDQSASVCLCVRVVVGELFIVKGAAEAGALVLSSFFLSVSVPLSVCTCMCGCGCNIDGGRKNESAKIRNSGYPRLLKTCTSTCGAQVALKTRARQH